MFHSLFMVEYIDNYIIDAFDTLPCPHLDLSWDIISLGISAYIFQQKVFKKNRLKLLSHGGKQPTGLGVFLYLQVSKPEV